MKRALYIQIDENPAPFVAENEYFSLDCRCINDFCSLVGDALVGDLKDSDGTPIYRLLKSAGRLISDFEQVDKHNYELIITQWLDILGEISHKGVLQCEEKFIIRFPQQYTDWLLCNENDYYAEIGKFLHTNDDKVYLDTEGISEDIISALYMKISRFLNNKKDEIDYIVFSDERIGNASYAVKRLKSVFESCSFLQLSQWLYVLQEKQQMRIENLEDYKIFKAGKFILGVSRKEELGDDIDESYTYKYNGYYLNFKGGI